MTTLIHFAPLHSGDAKEIAKLQHRLFSPELRESVEEIRGILLNTEKHMVCNLSFGAYDGLNMIGYVFAYVETESLFYQRDEIVLYIKEIALRPRYESVLRSLFSKLYQQWHAFTPGIPLEAHALPDSLANWNRMTRLFKHYGLTPTDTEDFREPGRPPYRLLRFEVSETTSQIGERTRALQKGWSFEDNITVTVVNDENQWLSLPDCWQELLDDTDDSNIFQSFDYLWLWWKYYGTWHELRVVVIRDGAEIIGIVPLMMTFIPVYGRIMRNLMFITARMDMSRPKLIFGANSDRCVPAFVAWLEHEADNWDIFDIDEQLGDSSTETLKCELRRIGNLVAESETLCPYISLDSTWEKFLATRSKRLRGNVRRLRRKLAKNGEVNIRTISELSELDSAMDIHCDVEANSWKAEKKLHLANDKSDYCFHRALAQTFGRQRAFEMRVMECGGEAIATTYGLSHNGVYQSMKIAHDCDYDRFSPGTLLESYELESMFDSDVDVYEFMGSFLANKLRWTSDVIVTTNLHVFRRMPRLKLFYFIYFAFRPKIKAALKRTGYFDRLLKWANRRGLNPFSHY